MNAIDAEHTVARDIMGNPFSLLPNSVRAIIRAVNSERMARECSDVDLRERYIMDARIYFAVVASMHDDNIAMVG